MFRHVVSAVAVVALFNVALAQSADKVIGKSVKGKPEIRSINVLSFAPDGVLLIGDGQGSQIFAVETGDASPRERLSQKIEAIDAKLAGRLGAKPDGIEIIDLAVNPVSGTAYIAVRKQDDKSYVVLTVDGEGKIGELELDDVNYARIKLSVENGNISLITDVAWADSQLVAAGRSSEQFSSKIFGIKTPLEHEAAGNVFTAETYHVSHGRWETKAPMSVLIPLKEDGKDYVVGAFSCTPVVKYPLDALQPGATVKGISVVELGSGNRPIDMFVYEKEGKQFVLANTFRFHHQRKPFGPSPYWTVKFEQNLLVEKENVNEKAIQRLKGNYEPATDKIELVEAFHGVTQMDRLDEKRALALREVEKGVSLEPLPLP